MVPSDKGQFLPISSGSRHGVKVVTAMQGGYCERGERDHHQCIGDFVVSVCFANGYQGIMRGVECQRVEAICRQLGQGLTFAAVRVKRVDLLIFSADIADEPVRQTPITTTVFMNPAAHGMSLGSHSPCAVGIVGLMPQSVATGLRV